MEISDRMKSRVTHDGDLLIISTPKTRSWILIFLFSILILQNSYGMIRGLLFETQLTLHEKLFILVFCPTVISLALKGLLWQLKGVKILEIGLGKITFRKKAPLTSRKKEYDITAIKSIRIRNEAVSTGPSAMLQLLGIIDSVGIDLSYGYTTIKTVGGFSLTEASELEKLIREKTGIA